MSKVMTVGWKQRAHNFLRLLERCKAQRISGEKPFVHLLSLSRRRGHEPRCANIYPIMFQPQDLPEQVGRDVLLALGTLDVVRHFGTDGVKCLNTKNVPMDSVTGGATGRRPQEIMLLLRGKKLLKQEG